MRSAHALLAMLALAPMQTMAQDGIVQAKRYALVIGINTYLDTGVTPLAYAVSDAKSMKNALIEQGYDVKDVLIDDDATREKILERLLEVTDQVRQEDVFVLYFAGHGTTTKHSRRAYWLNHNGSRSKPQINGLAVRTVVQLVSEMPARRKLLILDHCYSGDVNASTDYTVDEDRKALEATEADLKYVEPGSGTALPPDSIIFNMAAARGVAYEDEKGHGFMTYALLNALEVPSQNINETWSFHDLAVRIKAAIADEVRDREIVQEPVFPILGSRDTTVTTWAPFLRPISNLDDYTVKQHIRLELYVNKGQLDTDAQSELENMMARLQSSPAEGATPEDRSAFIAMRWIIASGADEPSIANALNQLGKSLIR